MLTLRSVGVADISPGPHPGERRFEPGTEHGPVVYGLRSEAFTLGNGVQLSAGLR